MENESFFATNENDICNKQFLKTSERFDDANRRCCVVF